MQVEGATGVTERAPAAGKRPQMCGAFTFQQTKAVFA